MTPKQQTAYGAVINACENAGHEHYVGYPCVRCIAAALAERDREIETLVPLSWNENAGVFYGNIAGQYSQGCTKQEARRAIVSAITLWVQAMKENYEQLRARRGALVEAVEIALRYGGLTAHYDHMTWPAVRAALAEGKGAE